MRLKIYTDLSEPSLLVNGISYHNLPTTVQSYMCDFYPMPLATCHTILGQVDEDKICVAFLSLMIAFIFSKYSAEPSWST